MPGALIALLVGLGLLCVASLADRHDRLAELHQGLLPTSDVDLPALPASAA